MITGKKLKSGFCLIESVEIECDFVKTYVAIGREGSGVGFESP